MNNVYSNKKNVSIALEPLWPVLEVKNSPGIPQYQLDIIHSRLETQITLKFRSVDLHLWLAISQILLEIFLDPCMKILQCEMYCGALK